MTELFGWDAFKAVQEMYFFACIQKPSFKDNDEVMSARSKLWFLGSSPLIDITGEVCMIIRDTNNPSFLPDIDCNGVIRPTVAEDSILQFTEVLLKPSNHGNRSHDISDILISNYTASNDKVEMQSKIRQLKNLRKALKNPAHEWRKTLDPFKQAVIEKYFDILKNTCGEGPRPAYFTKYTFNEIDEMWNKVCRQ